VSSVREAFDRHAAVYDKVFLSSQIRTEVWQVADPLFQPGSRILDLGCGTGEDAIHFSQRGIHVTAIDLSPEMIARLRAKSAGIVHGEVADMQSYSFGRRRFDGIFSNFGALNCSADLSWFGKLARSSLTPGSHVVVTAMGRFYPLEFAVFLLKCQPDLALRRFRRPATATIEGLKIDVHYHSVRAIRSALGREFRLCRVLGLRSLLPVPGLEHLERFSALRLLKPIDRWICRNRLTAACSDHFVSVWEYRGSQ